jgi:hypothetical protein
MTVAPYSRPADLYDFGLPRGAVPNPGRLAASVLAASDAFTLDDHGLDLGSPFTVRAEAGGALPAPLVVGTTYYAIPLSASTWQAAATQGSLTPIDLTTDGTRVIVCCPLPVSSAIEWADRLIDEMCPADAVPFVGTIPSIIRITSAEMAAWKLAQLRGTASTSLSEMLKAVQTRLATWAKGVRVRGDNTTAHTNTAASASAPYNDRRGWSRNGGL